MLYFRANLNYTCCAARNLRNEASPSNASRPLSTRNTCLKPLTLKMRLPYGKSRIALSVLTSIFRPRSSNFLRHYEWRAVLATQHGIGGAVLDDLLFRGVEFDRTPDSI